MGCQNVIFVDRTDVASANEFVRCSLKCENAHQVVETPMVPHKNIFNVSPLVIISTFSYSNHRGSSFLPRGPLSVRRK